MIIAVIINFISLFSPAAHCVFPDVETMEQILTKTALVNLLSSLPRQPIRQQLQIWHQQKELRRRTTTLLHTLGRRITAAQVKCLHEISLCYTPLCTMSKHCSSEAEFHKAFQQQEWQASTYNRRWLKSYQDGPSWSSWAESSFLFFCNGFSKSHWGECCQSRTHPLHSSCYCRTATCSEQVQALTLSLHLRMPKGSHYKTVPTQKHPSPCEEWAYFSVQW